MEKTKKEINKLIDKETSPNEKYELSKYESILNNAFLPAEITKQKRMTSVLDLNSKTVTSQKSNYTNELVNGLLPNSLNISIHFFKKNLIWMIIIPVVTMLFTFINIGIVPTEAAAASLDDPMFAATITKSIFNQAFFIPTMLWMWWAIPSYILSIREDNYISRLKMKGYSEIQLVLTIFVISILTLLAFQFIIMEIWLPITYALGLIMNDELSNGYFHWGKINYAMLLVHLIPYLMIMSFIGIVIGFKSKSVRFVIAVLVVFLITGLFIAYTESWFIGADYNNDLMNVIHGLRFLNIPFILGASIQYDLTTITTLSEHSINVINNLGIIISLFSFIIPLILILGRSKKIVSYKPIQ